MWKWLGDLLGRQGPPPQESAVPVNVGFVPADTPVTEETERLARSVLSRAQALAADLAAGETAVVEVTEEHEDIDPALFSLSCAKLASEYGLQFRYQHNIEVAFIKV